jgi:hypothetical protein
VPVTTISVGQRYAVGFLEDRFEILAQRRSEILPYCRIATSKMLTSVVQAL